MDLFENNAEANVQAEFYHHARLAERPVALELSTPAGRIDIAVLSVDRSAIVAVVECKRNWKQFKGGKSPQIMRYKRLGLPVYGLAEFSRAKRLVEVIQASHGASAGISLQAIRDREDIRQSRLDRLSTKRYRRLQRGIEELSEHVR